MSAFARLSLLSLLACVALQADVFYSVTSLGAGAWRYSYTIDVAAFPANQGITFHFDPALYSALVNPVVPAGWDYLLFQPNDPPDATGEFDLFALDAGPPLLDISIDFTYLAAGTPGSQPFTIYSYTPDFTEIETGFTIESVNPVNPVPEPAAGLLFLVCLAALAPLRHRQQVS